jgi:integrin beta 3
MSPEIETLLAELAPVIARLVDAEVAREVRHVLAELRLRDGRDGLPGVPGPPGERGAPGDKGADGRNGIDGTLEGVTFIREDRAIIVRRADFTEIGRWLTLEMIDRGQYRAGAAYQWGDVVTYAGSLWVAKADTDARPAEGDGPWRLMVRRGERGPAGTRGERGPTGDKGAQGLPGGRYT